METLASVRGLTSGQAAALAARGEVNRVRPPSDRTYLRIILEHALPPINIGLYSVSLVLLAMGLVVDALVTLGPVAAYVGVGIWQEARAKRQLDRIALLHRPLVRVRRDGRDIEIDASLIVTGDIIVLSRGDQVPVDGRVVAGELEADEALLTGESEPTARSRGDRVSSGTAVVSGRALVEADRIGAETIASRLLASARRVRVERTPGQRAIQRVILGATAVVAAAAALVAARLLGADDATWADAARAAAVLVALVPQGLLVVVTITYAMAAARLAARGAVIQRIGSIESMSHADTLCVDKTGTLTTGAIRLHTVEALSPAGEGRLAAVAASMEPPNPTLLAVRAARPEDSRSVRWQVPFSSARRWSAVAFEDEPDCCHLIAAADIAVGLLRDPIRATALADRVASLTATGHRVLLYGTAAADEPAVDLPPSLDPVALLAFSEQLRPDAATILGALRSAGLEVKIVSGDDPRTVAALARAAGLEAESAPVDASRLDSGASAAARIETLQRASLFGRVGPEAKAELVAGLRTLRRYVAMVGDGVNDILALKRANIGIAMGSGSAATRAVADIVLLGDDLTLLPPIVRGGQRIVSAISTTLELLLARTASMVVIVALAAVVGLPFPFTPRTNSILALLTVGIPTLVLALIVAPARPAPHLLRSALRFAIPSGLGMAIPALIGYTLLLSSTGDLRLARTGIVALTTLFGIGLVTLIARRWSRPVVRRLDRWRVWSLAAVMALLFAVIAMWPPTRDFFDLAPLPIPLLVALAAVGLAWTAAAHVATGTLVPSALRVTERHLHAVAPRAAEGDTR
jgi:cation-transporting ATPase E